MEEFKTPVVPKTVTVRRNPHRKARTTPASAVPLPLPLSSPSVVPQGHNIIPSFPLQDILSIELPSSASQNPKKLASEDNLNVFLRIRPLTISSTKSTVKQQGGVEVKNAWPKNPKTKIAPRKKIKPASEICIAVKDAHSVTVTPPKSLPEGKRVKSEVYEGFSRVFSAEFSQGEVYEKMVHPMVEDFLKGKSGMLAALGPSGSGKTHTVFGCAREPGMVPLALRHIFSGDENNGKRACFLSMFEICSEKGKSERLFDLLRGDSEVYILQSVIKGLEEVKINDALQAESLISGGMLRRSTAATNSNSQSSRSQCIINICCIPEKIDGEFEDEPAKASLTIVDLAGAEREKKTGNQGLRKVESNFINNTSMVFGLCLRSLLEYQKNPKRPLQKHFQNSLLTRYLREYLEGKKRMALILTVKPGEDDYPETSNLLKQASPYAQIKFTSTEELGKRQCGKRPNQIYPMAEHLKRIKLTVEDSSVYLEKEDQDGNLKEIAVESEESLHCKLKDGSSIELEKREREHHIMVNFAKALWVVLKEYKKKLEIAEKEICCVRDDLINERKRSSDLENQVNDLKVKYSSGDIASAEVNISFVAASCIGTDSFQEQYKQKHEKSCIPYGLSEFIGDSKDLRAVDIYSDNGATVSIASHIGAEERCEGTDETAGAFGDPQVLNDRKEPETVTETTKLIGCENASMDNTCTEIEATDSLESAASRPESSVNTSSCLEEKESAISYATISDSAASFPLPPVVESGHCSSQLKLCHMPHEQHEKELNPTVIVVPEDDASLTQETHSLPTRSSEIKQKPKRRLQPSSSILLKDIDFLTLDENDKPKGVKGDKGLAMETRNKSKGNLSLLRLLRNDFFS